VRHPIAIAALAAGTTVLVAALQDARPVRFFLAFGVMCFGLAAMARDEALSDTSRPLLCVIAGTMQVAAFGAMREARAADPFLTAFAVLGFSCLLFGTIAWVRTRLS